jgi:hypothetical protein
LAENRNIASLTPISSDLALLAFRQSERMIMNFAGTVDQLQVEMEMLLRPNGKFAWYILRANRSMKFPFLLFGIAFLVSGVAAIYYLRAKQPPELLRLIFNQWKMDENINRVFVLIYGVGMVVVGTVFTVIGVLELRR